MLLVMIRKIALNTVKFVKYIRLLILIMTLPSLLFGSAAFAVEVTNLYTGKILVNDKTQKTRVKAHRWAIEQVLSKVTGNQKILENPVIQREVKYKSANYIKSFAFKTDDQDRTFLVDQFYQTKIDDLIKSVGGSLWGRRRPNTLVWLVIEEGVNRSIVELEQYPQLSEVLNQSSDDRGIPLLLPLMDTIDKEAIYSSDIWARFEAPVNAASKRYNVDNYIMARMRYVNSTKGTEYQQGWLLQFQLMKENKPLLIGEFNGDQFSVVRQMVNNIGDYYASEYAIDSEQTGADSLELTLENVPNVVALTRAEKYLKSLPPVADVQLLQVHKHQVKFLLNLSGEGGDVIRALALLPEFEKLKDPDQPVTSLSIDEQLKSLEYLDDTNTAEANSGVLSNTDPLVTTPVSSDPLSGDALSDAPLLDVDTETKVEVKKKTIYLNYKWLGK
ncbi:hypothetical protein BTO11_13870 [Psychrosphaera saromensis]|uniref:DUF2066 domain-containing protein n=1 Tax=Psychrosphaera saromensis TaxID=716813 RepID=A0A2S7UX98_9GAMM|nr:hypothetical protein BTO11_13870 [Psychrosphaera saromensis]